MSTTAPSRVTLLAPVRPILHAVATTLIPESSSLDTRAWTELETVIEDALARRDASVRRQLIAFLRLLQYLPIARYGRPLTTLNTRQRRVFLESIEYSSLLRVRRGFWGLRTLVFMGYYTRDDVAAEIGYNPSAGGWTVRGGTFSTVPLAPMLWVEP